MFYLVCVVYTISQKQRRRHFVSAANQKPEQGVPAKPQYSPGVYTIMTISQKLRRWHFVSLANQEPEQVVPTNNKPNQHVKIRKI